jgi:hypothetical protein
LRHPAVDKQLNSSDAAEVVEGALVRINVSLMTLPLVDAEGGEISMTTGGDYWMTADTTRKRPPPSFVVPVSERGGAVITSHSRVRWLCARARR